jgi:hypothetical protein
MEASTVPPISKYKIVGDDAMWDAESNHNVLDKFEGSFAIKFSDGLSFHPLREFVYRYQEVRKSRRCCF